MQKRPQERGRSGQQIQARIKTIKRNGNETHLRVERPWREARRSTISQSKRPGATLPKIGEEPLVPKMGETGGGVEKVET